MSQGHDGGRGPALPTAAQVDAALNDARHLFSRTLANWVGDVLELRRRGTLSARWNREQRRLAGQGSDLRRAA